MLDVLQEYLYCVLHATVRQAARSRWESGTNKRSAEVTENWLFLAALIVAIASIWPVTAWFIRKCKEADHEREL